MTRLFNKVRVVRSLPLRTLLGLSLFSGVVPLFAQPVLTPLTQVSEKAIGTVLNPAAAAPTLVSAGDGGVIDLSDIPADDLLGLGGGAVISLAEPRAQNSSATANLDKGRLHSLSLQFCDDDDGDAVCNSQDYCKQTPPQAVVLPNGCHLTRDAPLELVGVFFDFNGTALRPESHEILDRVVAVLRQQSQVVVEIGGHTDSRGRVEVNQKLSEKRAKAVYDYLMGKGIAAYRLRYKGYGERQPVAANHVADGGDNAAGRARNRRVDLRVVGDVAPITKSR